MHTFSSTNIVKKNIITKPYLLTVEELNTIGRDINLVGFDPLRTSATGDEFITLRYGNSASPRLLNYVEEYVIAGFSKTLFYSEVNTGLKINDKVFIINGSYDSNLLIKNDKYKKGSDGYTVLFIDKCRIVLDIDFTGYLPANEDTVDPVEDVDQFVKVYYVKDRNDFIQVNRQITTIGEEFDYKFGYNKNNIIFTKQGYDPILGWGESAGLVGSGFFVKDGINTWTNITSEFMSGSFSYALSTNDNSGGKVLILNGTFTQSYSTASIQDFKEDSVYKWNDINWEINIKHSNNNPPIITKSNFRNGQFNGIWNGGLFGSNEKRIKWNSDSSTFNSGTLLNTVWEKGIINSIYSQEVSYVAEISDNFNKPYEKITNPDNNGYGFNFIINSDIQNSVINNGNLSNTTLGSQSSSYIVVEEHLKGNLDSIAIESNFSNIINKALFDNCRFIDANIENAEVRNSRATNTRFNNIKSVNSHYKTSLIINSNYISDNIIKILDYSETTIYDYNHIKVFKFYINKRSYEKFKFKDTFYIKGIKFKDNSKVISNFFDKKFRIGSWTEYDDVLGTSYYKRGIQYSAFSSTPNENDYFYSVDGNTNNNTTKGIDRRYSIDIFINTKDITDELVEEYYNLSDIDYSSAFIIESDFESGVFENSNWNSGRHFNYSNDVNITIPGNEGGFYNIGLTGPNSSSYNLGLTGTSLMVTVPHSSYYKEIEEDYLAEGNIVFLNNVDYDTSGKVSRTQISQLGRSHGSGTFSVTSLSGTGYGLLLNIDSTAIGSITSIGSSSIGNGYSVATSSNPKSTTTNGAGSGLTIYSELASASDAIIVNGGIGYSAGTTFSINYDFGGGGIPTIFTVNSTNNGEIISASIVEGGLGYAVGDIVRVNSGEESKILIAGITGSVTRLPSSYKIEKNFDNGLLRLNDILLTETSLAPGGRFLTVGANNRYGYLHTAKFTRSKIKSGFFKSLFIEGSLIKNDSYDVSDKDFNDLEKIKTLVIKDSIFCGNFNILSKGLYMNSYFVYDRDLVSDTWDNGILYNSIWNKMTFVNGLVKESTWIDGVFNSGLFYDSNTFNGSTSSNYNDNLIDSYYKSGALPNNRYSWQRGSFLNGEFYKSDWENGEFNGGKFYYSKFYNGVVNNGQIGDSSIPLDNTVVYNGVINFTIVENSTIISSNYGLSNNKSSIHWKNGLFNSGIFGNSGLNTATWSGGIFNNGEFLNKAKWEDGTFNGGKFLSTYKYETVDEIDMLFSWDNGTFNGGVFGNAKVGENSTWKYGNFNGGIFQGKVWENGLFSAGEFIGSATFSAFGGTSSGSIAPGNADKFTEGFKSEYYGLWRNGIVTNIKDPNYVDKKRIADPKRDNNRAIFKKILWKEGVFNHTNGEIRNSVWLSGSFENGLFKSSSFNSYVKRNNELTPSFSFEDNCVWNNGVFDGGDFYISNWNNGKFISGTAYGMIWNNGVSDYMNAYNVFWNDGVWKNGNWNGSYFNINESGGTSDDFVRNVISRGNTASLHAWNIFYKEPISSNDVIKNRNTGGRGLVYLDSVVSDVPDTPILTAIQYIDGVGGITSRIVLSWTGGYSGYGIAGYEISYMLSGDINWNIIFINSTLSDDIYLYTANFNCNQIHFKIRAKDSIGNYSGYSEVYVQIIIILKLSTTVQNYTSELANISTFCPGAITTSQNVYTTYTFGAGSTIYNTFTGGILNNTFAGDNTFYRSLNNLNTGEKYIVAIGPLGVIPESVSGLNNSLPIYKCLPPVPTPPTPIPTLLVSKFVSSGNLITLYRETNGKTRGQLSGVPLSTLYSEHPSTNNANGIKIDDDSWQKTANGLVQNIFYKISDKNRTLRIVGNISFNTLVTNYDDVNYFVFRLGLTTYRNAASYTWKRSNILLSITNESLTLDKFIKESVSYSIPFDINLNILAGESISLHFDENYDGRNNRSSHFGISISNIDCSLSIEEVVP
jgi:hypothetical protein